MINNWENLSEIELIRQVILKRNSELLPLVDFVDHVPLTHDQRHSLRGLILEEFLEEGVNKEYDPNSYGLRLEEMIDYLGRDM